MVENTLVKDALTREMIAIGKEIVQRLGKSAEITAAFWFYDAEANVWRLFFASPLVAIQGKRELYRQLQALLGNLAAQTSTLELSDIALIADDDPLVAILRAASGTGRQAAGLRLTRQASNGHLIEDAYLYNVT